MIQTLMLPQMDTKTAVGSRVRSVGDRYAGAGQSVVAEEIVDTATNVVVSAATVDQERTVYRL